MNFAPFPLDVAGGRLSLQGNTPPRAAAPPTPAPALPRPEPRWIPPPPRRGLSLELGQGKPTAPKLTEAQIESVRSKARTAAEALQYELEAVKLEADWVSGPTLRVEPEKYKSVAVVGPYFTPQEMRTQVTLDARAIDQAATRMLTGASSPYLEPETMDVLRTIVKDAKDLVAHIEQFDLQPIGGNHTRLSEDHLQSHVKSVKQLIDSVEREVVSAEAASVPVTEPGDSGSALGTLVAVGALAAVALIVFDIL